MGIICEDCGKEIEYGGEWTEAEGVTSWYRDWVCMVIALDNKEPCKHEACKETFVIRHTRLVILLYKLNIEPNAKC
jgi:hypothetical protein